MWSAKAYRWFRTRRSEAWIRGTVRTLLIGALACCSAFAQLSSPVPQASNPPLPPLRPSVQERLGYPANARLLIIHADDLGMAHSVNRATFEALEKGWITSSSILVPCPWFPEVVHFAQSHPNADLGIHLALNSEWTDYRWTPVSSREKVPSLLDREGYMPLDETIVAKQATASEAALELQGQIDRALSSGIHISHLDTHMTALVGSPELFRAYQAAGSKYGLPILVGDYKIPAGASLSASESLVQRVIGIDPGVSASEWAGWYKKTLAALPPGVYELIVHLAYDDDEMRGMTRDHPDWGAAWRQRDFDLVRSADFQQFLRAQGFMLITWKELMKALPSASSSHSPY